jgi:hypothetical protein
MKPLRQKILHLYPFKNCTKYNLRFITMLTLALYDYLIFG